MDHGLAETLSADIVHAELRERKSANDRLNAVGVIRLQFDMGVIGTYLAIADPAHAQEAADRVDGCCDDAQRIAVLAQRVTEFDQKLLSHLGRHVLCRFHAIQEDAADAARGVRIRDRAETIRPIGGFTPTTAK